MATEAGSMHPIEMHSCFDRVVFARPGGELADGGPADHGPGMDVLHLDGDVRLPDLLGRVRIHCPRETKPERWVRHRSHVPSTLSFL